MAKTVRSFPMPGTRTHTNTRVVFTFMQIQRTIATAVFILLSRNTSAYATSPPTSTLNLTSAQCSMMARSFETRFVDARTGIRIESCQNELILKMWKQCIQRKYLEPSDLATFSEQGSLAQLRNLPDDRFVQMVIDAAVGSLHDASHPNELVSKVRVNVAGEFERYTPQERNEIIALQVMLLIAIVALAWLGRQMQAIKSEKTP